MKGAVLKAKSIMKFTHQVWKGFGFANRIRLLTASTAAIKKYAFLSGVTVKINIH
jgi:hypothetical protein